MTIREQVKQALESLDIVDPQIEFFDNFGYRVVARLVSPSFEKIDDGDRQAMVWGKLSEVFGDEKSWQFVEFIFTDSPSELEAYKAEAANNSKP